MHYWCTRELSFGTIAERHTTHSQHSLVQAYELLILIASPITEFADKSALPHGITGSSLLTDTVSRIPYILHTMLQNFRLVHCLQGTRYIMCYFSKLRLFYVRDKKKLKK